MAASTMDSHTRPQSSSWTLLQSRGDMIGSWSFTSPGQTHDSAEVFSRLDQSYSSVIGLGALVPVSDRVLDGRQAMQAIDLWTRPDVQLRALTG
jgi:hypothetical protein